jgi:glycosyltransferase involved in cell wall biosynthesis
MSTDPASTARPAAGIAVVIPTHNRQDRLDVLLATLRADGAREGSTADAAAAAAEIIVVDDGSTDRTPEVIASHAAADGRVVGVRRSSGGGAAAARLAGAQAATADIILFLDDDVAPSAGLVANHLRRHRERRDTGRDGRRGLVVVGYMPTPVPTDWSADTFVTALYSQEYEGRCRHYEEDPASVLRNLWMGNVSLPRELFLDVTERWPEPLPVGRHEDQHIGLRLLEVGADAVFDRSLLATHEHQRTLAKFRRESWFAGVGHCLIERSHPDALVAGGARRYRADLPAVPRAVVALTTPRFVYRPVASTMAAVARGAGRARRFGVQTTVARLLRRVEQQQGYLSACRRLGRGGSVPGSRGTSG